VVAIPIEEWSVKVSDSPPDVVSEDEGWTPWTGWVPVRLVPGEPVTVEGDTVPPYVGTWQW
jgi:hypothetical protein